MNYTEGQKLYRFVDKMFGSWSWDLNGEMRYCGSYPEVWLETYVVVKVTPKGAWIQLGDRTGNGLCCFARRWVSTETRFVSQTQEEAKRVAIARRAYHLRMAQGRAREVEMRLDALRKVEVG